MDRKNKLVLEKFKSTVSNHINFLDKDLLFLIEVAGGRFKDFCFLFCMLMSYNFKIYLTRTSIIYTFPYAKQVN